MQPHPLPYPPPTSSTRPGPVPSPLGQLPCCCRHHNIGCKRSSQCPQGQLVHLLSTQKTAMPIQHSRGSCRCMKSMPTARSPYAAANTCRHLLLTQGCTSTTQAGPAGPLHSSPSRFPCPPGDQHPPQSVLRAALTDNCVLRAMLTDHCVQLHLTTQSSASRRTTPITRGPCTQQVACWQQLVIAL